MNPFVSNGNKLGWKFEDVKNLTQFGKFSDKFKIGSTEWKINTRAGLTENVKYLEVYLYYDSENVNEKNWICQTDKTITLINQNENGNDKSKHDTQCYSNSCFSWGWIRFYKWNDLIKDGFIKNDSIIIDVDFSFKYYDFSKNIPHFTDITLKVENTEFHTNKAILCNQSEYFYDLLINKNHEQTVVEIKDIESIDFRYFLASFYPFFDCVKEENYEKLIDLAVKYKAPTLHKNCENYLLKDSKISLEKKLGYADKYDYYELMKQCVQSLDNAQKIKNLRKTDEFRNFKESTKLMIMIRVLDFC